MRAPATHIGDIFEIPLDNKKRYMQFVVVDSSQLGGWGIRIFKKEYSLEDTPSIENILADEVDFYCLTYAIGHGVLDGLWKKYGKSKDCGDLNRIIFRTYQEGILTNQKSFWYVWRACQRDKRYKVLPNRYLSVAYGAVMHPISVINRIKTGRWYARPNVYDDYKGTTLFNHLLGIEPIPEELLVYKKSKEDRLPYLISLISAFNGPLSYKILIKDHAISRFCARSTK